LCVFTEQYTDAEDEVNLTWAGSKSAIIERILDRAATEICYWISCWFTYKFAYHSQLCRGPKVRLNYAMGFCYICFNWHNQFNLNSTQYDDTIYELSCNMHNETSHGNYSLMNTKLQDFSLNCGSQGASGSCQRQWLSLSCFTLLRRESSLWRHPLVCARVCVCAAPPFHFF
jgi:hypothetical protein